MKIFVFSFNTQSVRFYESLNSNIVAQHRSDNLAGWLYNGQYADFLPKLIQKIIDCDAEIVVFCSQEEVYPGSYFHTHLLKNEMNKILFSVLEESHLMGIGKTSVQNICKADPTVRGLVCSVYVKEQIFFTKVYPRIIYEKKYYTDSIFRNKGATCIYLTINNKTCAIINAHLPFNSESLTQSVQKKDEIIRQDALNKQNDFFNTVYRNLYLESKAQHVILAGDFNHRFHPYVNWSAQQTCVALMNFFPITEQNKEQFIKIFNESDEFAIQKQKKNIYDVDEGVNSEGPLFAPTCKLDKTRSPGQLKYKCGKYDQRTPSYCDRIFYKNIDCLSYDIFDEDNINLSDHVAVIGLFELI